MHESGRMVGFSHGSLLNTWAGTATSTRAKWVSIAPAAPPRQFVISQGLEERIGERKLVLESAERALACFRPKGFEFHDG